MKKIYLIPGLGEKCTLVRYRNLAEALSSKGYEVVPVNPDWYQPLLSQIFPVEKDAIICGFSFGAVMAYLIAQKYPCKKVIMASISPIHLFSFESLRDDYLLHMDSDMATKLAREIKSIEVRLNTLATPYTILAGEREKMLLTECKPDIIVPATGHFMSKAYIQCIADIV
ncbi:MAG: hypothetical protein WDZ88_01420 [Candidatus Paceibacterota bacterium]